MRNVHRGFTLIELLIVVAIIGILASLAIPIYKEYTIKSMVGECGSLSGSSKAAINKAANDGTLSPTTNNASLSLAAAANITGRYVASVTVTGTALNTGTIQCAFWATTEYNGTNGATKPMSTDIAGKVQGMQYRPSVSAGQVGSVVFQWGKNTVYGTTIADPLNLGS